MSAQVPAVRRAAAGGWPVWLPLVLVAAAAWAYLVTIDRQMAAMPDDFGGLPLLMPMSTTWGPTEAVLIFLMWWVMMVAMMVPTLVPLLLLVAGRAPSGSGGHERALRAVVLIAGYSAVWALFSAVATAAHWGLLQGGLISPMAVARRQDLAGVLLVVAGVFQWTPLKNFCLIRCRSPLGLVLTEWRPGAAGAFRLGWLHGRHCLGCCWALMGLLFVFGAMNLLWVAALSAVVVVEKVLVRGLWPSRVLGVGLVAWGGWLLL